MEMGGTFHGDPLEASALKGIGWGWNTTTHIAQPNAEIANFTAGAGSVDAAVDGDMDGDGVQDGGIRVAVWRRHAFSSQLQRMSVIGEVFGAGLTAEKGVHEVGALSFRIAAHIISGR